MQPFHVVYNAEICNENDELKQIIMETAILEDDVKVFYVSASSFPDGIMEAHTTLHSLVPSYDRKYFGISRPEQGVIRYKAAATELFEGEGAELHCETVILKKGNYISITIIDYMKDLQSIGNAFKDLLLQPDLDSEGYCVERYLNEKDVVCMIRLK